MLRCGFDLFLVSQLWERVSLLYPRCSLLLCIPFRLQSFLFVVLLLWLERCGFFPQLSDSAIASSTFSTPKNYGLLWEIRVCASRELLLRKIFFHGQTGPSITDCPAYL